MKKNQILEEYSPEEAKGLWEFKFLGWLFLIIQGGSVILIVGLLTNLFPRIYVGSVLDVISQNTTTIPLIILALAHTGILLVQFLKRPIGWTITLTFLAGMTVFSILEMILFSFDPFNLAGIGHSALWILYFLFSKRVRLRFFYQDLFNRERLTIVCPHCREEVILDSEKCCGAALTEDDRFNALCLRITDPKVPIDVRVAQIELLDERFGKKCLPFFKEQFQRQLKSPIRVAKIAATLNRLIDKYS
ncbi:hypothetical protein GF359_04505 [candidate division WOR-3 bacterium]|uniref:Uncharacterized protein n=1 Tax=candidate division WOR-3 bacterium TaxID=2052148 RepID=A0A9D5K8S5_UNCW3|nr:hypothetical protein [candidate division WOR-3 bacterium]MBD3364456.1 hypothetical protein [candidate division WOR-3 bacterium]